MENEVGRAPVVAEADGADAVITSEITYFPKFPNHGIALHELRCLDRLVFGNGKP